MTNITELIKELRTKTGAGFLDCKKSLEENNNDIEKAIDSLRKKGLSKASKKSDREANEGAIGVYSNENITAIIKVNSETDFAAKSDTFLNFLDELGSIAIDNAGINITKEDFLNLKYNNTLISEFFDSMIAKIGENLILNDLVILDKRHSDYSFYIHNSYKKNIGKIISLVQYNTKNNDDTIKLLAKNLCMHIAAMKPESLDVQDLDEVKIKNEEKIQRELILNSGKPSNIVDKILQGKMKKYFSEVTLLNQSYILDQDKNVGTIINDYKDFDFKIISFALISL